MSFSDVSPGRTATSTGIQGSLRLAALPSAGGPRRRFQHPQVVQFAVGRVTWALATGVKAHLRRRRRGLWQQLDPDGANLVPTARRRNRGQTRLDLGNHHHHQVSIPGPD